MNRTQVESGKGLGISHRSGNLALRSVTPGRRAKVAGRLCCVLLVLACARPLFAQTGTGALVSYQIDVYDVTLDPYGVATPLWTTTVPAAAALCNLAPLPAPKSLTQVNPQAVYWTDVVNAGKICKLSVPLLGTLPQRPGAYVLTVLPIDDHGWPGLKSAVSLPFMNLPPAALTGVAVR